VLAHPEAVASYSLRATLDPERHTVLGDGTLRWKNASRVPQRELYVHLYLNGFKSKKSLFLRTPMVRDLFLEFLRREFPWTLPGYLELFPRPGSAPREYREGLERLAERLARAAGFTARSRDERVRDEAPKRSRQLSLIW
jgi:hypothetical protein